MPDKLPEWVDEIPYNCRHFGEDILLFTRWSLANARKSEMEKTLYSSRLLHKLSIEDLKRRKR